MKKEILFRTVGICGILLVIAAVFLVKGCSRNETAVVRPDYSENVPDDSFSETLRDAFGIVVYVTGEVLHPGVYKLSENARLYEAIDLAGGFTENADPLSVNEAEVLRDGMHIHVYALDPDASFRPDTRLNINAAGVEELSTLPGIGTGKAQAIVDYRKKNGRFQSIEELKNVSGIGDALFEQIREKVKV